MTVADCEYCGGAGWVSALNPYGRASCTRCGGSGRVATADAFLEAVRELAGVAHLNANEAIEWLRREQVRRRGAA